jgi:hypothetical protein
MKIIICIAVYLVISLFGAVAFGQFCKIGRGEK